MKKNTCFTNLVSVSHSHCQDELLKMQKAKEKGCGSGRFLNHLSFYSGLAGAVAYDRQPQPVRMLRTQRKEGGAREIYLSFRTHLQ